MNDTRHRIKRPVMPKKMAGIGLLETLAALVILSVGATVMLTWFSQNASALSRLKETEKVEQAKLVALDYLRTLNPVDRPSGEIIIGQDRITWSSRTKVEPVRVVTAMGSPGRYEISLYDLDVRLSRANADAAVVTARMTFPVAGYKLVAAGGGAGGMFGGQ